LSNVIDSYAHNFESNKALFQMTEASNDVSPRQTCKITPLYEMQDFAFDDVDENWNLMSNDFLSEALDWGIEPAIPYAPGQIVRVADGECASRLAQVIVVDQEQRECLIKTFPRLDYTALKCCATRSQKWINKSRPVSYQAPVAAFDEAFFHPNELEFRELPIGELTVMCHFWDGDYYIGKFMYRWCASDALFPVGDAGITTMEKARFANGVAPFERDIPDFVQTLEATKVGRPILSSTTWWQDLGPRRSTSLPVKEPTSVHPGRNEFFQKRRGCDCSHSSSALSSEDVIPVTVWLA
jgi:hypothetical protein